MPSGRTGALTTLLLLPGAFQPSWREVIILEAPASVPSDRVRVTRASFVQVSLVPGELCEGRFCARRSERVSPCVVVATRISSHSLGWVSAVMLWELNRRQFPSTQPRCRRCRIETSDRRGNLESHHSSTCCAIYEKTQTHRDEQSTFLNLEKVTYGRFRGTENYCLRLTSPLDGSDRGFATILVGSLIHVVSISSKVGSMEAAKDCLRRSPGRKGLDVILQANSEPSSTRHSAWQILADCDLASWTDNSAYPN